MNVKTRGASAGNIKRQGSVDASGTVTKSTVRSSGAQINVINSKSVVNPIQSNVASSPMPSVTNMRATQRKCPKQLCAQASVEFPSLAV